MSEEEKKVKPQGAFSWDLNKKPEVTHLNETALEDDAFFNVFSKNETLMSWLNHHFNKKTFSADHSVMSYLEGQRDLAREIKGKIARSEKRRKSK